MARCSGRRCSATSAPCRRARAVVIVPVGSVEQHGPHLPLDVDISVPYHLAVRAAVRCADLPVLVAPPVTFGVAHYKMGEPGTISLRLETFLSLLCDVARSIWKNGFIASSSSTATVAISTRSVRRR